MLGLQPNWLLLLAAEEPAAVEAVGMSGWLILLILVAIFVVPFSLGSAIAKLLKLKEFSFKIGLVLFAATAGAAPFAFQVAIGNNMTDAIDLGIDLAGGTNLVFQVDHEGAEDLGKEVNNELMDKLVGAVGRRINPGGNKETTTRRVGADRIEVIIPGADRAETDRIKREIVNLGSLEFSILANGRDHASIIQKAQSVERDLRQGGKVIASWREVASDEPLSNHGEVAIRNVKNRQGNDTEVQEVLVIVEPDPKRRVDGHLLTRANQTMDENGAPAVGFTFNQEGGFRFQRLTGNNRPDRDGFQRRLAVLLSGKVHSAPNLQAIISTSGIITGRFSQEEINSLINVLNAGALDVPLKPQPISEFTISPTLGIEVQEKGKNAIVLALAIVFVFMLIYYKVAGAIADLCLLLNMVLVMGIMSFIDATFTLPGLAGLVLTIGMAVDANVLIFERIREEMAKGSSLRMAIHNGFERAFTTIVDANVTTLITAVVLYLIGTDQVKGFAVTLFIGIVMSMWTALFVGRLVFDVLERKQWISSLKMLSFVEVVYKIFGVRQFDFLGKRKIAAVVSLLIMVIGLTTLFSRGKDNLDIDFSGGTMVTFEFEEPQTKKDVQTILENEFGVITLERLTLADEPEGDVGKRYRLRTTKRDAVEEGETAADKTVRQMIHEAFEPTDLTLLKVTLEFGELTQIAGSEEPDETKEGETKTSAFGGNPFAGGNEVRLNFSESIKVATATEYFSAAISNLKGADGNVKYEDADSLYELIGPEQSIDETAVGAESEQMQLLVAADISADDLKTALTEMKNTLASTPLFDGVNSFASSVASEMQESAFLAMLFSLVAIVAYIWFRFQRITFGLAAVVALVHDVLIVLGLVALASSLSSSGIGAALGFVDFKINLPMIAAFLTIVGYSLNDTIVVFDRIREVRGKNPDLTYDMVNTSLNQTLARTLLTSLTTFLVVIILYAIGGEGIHGFAFCLVMGVIVGTYSSVYVASPVLLWLMNREGNDSGNQQSAGQSAT